MFKLSGKLNNFVKDYTNVLNHRSIYSTNVKLKWFKLLWNWVPKSNAILPILQAGDPILRQKSVAVPLDKIQSREVTFVIKKMIETLKRNNCVGLAAPQIGVSLQIIILEFKEELKKEFSHNIYKIRQMDTLPMTIFINPTIVPVNNNKKIFTESCESINGYAADVERFEEIKINGYDQNGKRLSLILKGWNARIAQHEMDHLDGKLYIDKMNSLTFRSSRSNK